MNLGEGHQVQTFRSALGQSRASPRLRQQRPQARPKSATVASEGTPVRRQTPGRRRIRRGAVNVRNHQPQKSQKGCLQDVQNGFLIAFIQAVGREGCKAAIPNTLRNRAQNGSCDPPSRHVEEMINGAASSVDIDGVGVDEARAPCESFCFTSTLAGSATC